MRAVQFKTSAGRVNDESRSVTAVLSSCGPSVGLVDSVSGGKDLSTILSFATACAAGRASTQF